MSIKILPSARFENCGGGTLYSGSKPAKAKFKCNGCGHKHTATGCNIKMPTCEKCGGNSFSAELKTM